MPDATTFLAFFFFNDTATTEIYTLSLHDALPISRVLKFQECWSAFPLVTWWSAHASEGMSRIRDRKSTRLNSSHQIISYAVFCLKKKKNVVALVLFATWAVRDVCYNQPPDSHTPR